MVHLFAPLPMGRDIYIYIYIYIYIVHRVFLVKQLLLLAAACCTGIRGVVTIVWLYSYTASRDD